MKLVIVEWVDSNLHHGWTDNDTVVFELANCTTVGMVVQKNKDKISLAQSESDNPNCCNVITILLKCVKSIKELVVKDG